MEYGCSALNLPGLHQPCIKYIRNHWGFVPFCTQLKESAWRTFHYPDVFALGGLLWRGVSNSVVFQHYLLQNNTLITTIIEPNLIRNKGILKIYEVENRHICFLFQNVSSHWPDIISYKYNKNISKIYIQQVTSRTRYYNLSNIFWRIYKMLLKQQQPALSKSHRNTKVFIDCQLGGSPQKTISTVRMPLQKRSCTLHESKL